eukprot:53796-Amphidinium_carterae.1
MQDDFAAEGLYVIPLLQPPTIRGDGPRVFAGYREEKAYRNAVNNASGIASVEHRCRLWLEWGDRSADGDWSEPDPGSNISWRSRFVWSI